MDTIPLYHAEIEELSERRVTLWNSLSQGRDPAVVEEIKALDAQLDELWAKVRAERARIRFGERLAFLCDGIVAVDAAYQHVNMVRRTRRVPCRERRFRARRVS